jgi:D-glycero-alpha-D-manno-heptose-7-phosphate kinase
MIISRTPFRISFFGGGTDYPTWYRNHGGAVLVTSINKYCYLSCRYLPPFFKHKYRVVYIKSENTKTIEEISHPAVRGILKHLEWRNGIEIHHDADLPARGGMGSSSAFTVGLVHALHALQGRMVSRYQLALESIHLEQNVLRETVGSQDQVSVAMGGLNHVRFLPGGEINVTPVTVGRDRIRELESHLMLFYSGIERTAARVAESYAVNIEEKAAQMHSMRALVDEGLSILNGRCDIIEFGKLLHEAWQIKRRFSHQVSNQRIDEIYETGRRAGAVGGKILGAGGGGFVLLFARPEDHGRIREELKELVRVPFKFENCGSQIIFFERDEDYSNSAIDNAACNFDDALDLEAEVASAAT